MFTRLTKDHFFFLAGLLFLAAIALVPLRLIELVPWVILASFAIGCLTFCYAMYGEVRDKLKIRGYRILFAGYHVMILFLSVLPVRGWVTVAMGMPGADYSTTCYFLTVLIYPLFWMSTILVFLLLTMFMFNVKSASDVMNPNTERAWEQIGIIGRFSGVFFSLIGIAVLAGLYIGTFLSPQAIKWIAYCCDYHVIRNYPGIRHDVPAMLHENGVVSYATIENRTVVMKISRVAANDEVNK